MPLRREDESSAVVALFTRVAAVTALVLIVFITVRGANGSKTWDKAAFFFSIVAAMLIAIWYVRRGAMKPNLLALVVCVGAFLWGIGTVERVPMSAYLWEGFGSSVVLVTIPVAVVVVPLSTWIRRSRLGSIAVAVLVAPLVAFDLYSLIRDVSNFANAPNNEYVLNEVLAPLAGRIPGANFVPQYTSLFGWIFLPFRNNLSADAVLNVATLTLSGFSVASVVLMVVLAKRCLPPRSLWLAVMVTVPLVSVIVRPDTIGSSLGSYFQELALRMFPAMVCTIVAVHALDGLLMGRVHTRTLVVLGLLTGLMAWDSQDIGVVLAIAGGLILQVAARGSLRKPTTLAWLIGLVAGLVSYPLWALGIGHPLRVQYLALAVRSFGSGYGAALMQVPGPVLIVLPVIVGSAVVGICLLWRSSGGSVELAAHERLSIGTLAFVGLWSVGFLPYYVNRSFASGQLQVFLMPFGICCCALLSLSLDFHPTARHRRRRASDAFANLHYLWLLPVTLPVALGFGALMQTPNPSVTASFMSHSPNWNHFTATLTETEIQTPGSGWPGAPGTNLYIQVTTEVSVMKRFVKAHGGGSIGYFGPSANYLSLKYGIEPRLLFDDPVDFSIGGAALKSGCSFLLHDPTTWLVTSPGSTAVAGSHMCGAYDPISVPKELPGTIFKLRKNSRP